MSAPERGSTLLLDAVGDPFTCGRLYGSAARSAVLGSLDAYRRLVEKRSDLRWPEAVAFAGRFEQCIGDLAPRSREELRGIAAGAGVEYGDVLALNCRSELLFLAGGSSTAGQPPASECSSFAVASPEGDVLGGQNWDWNPLLESSTTIRGFTCDDDPPAVTVCEGGHLAKVGFNAVGLLVCTNTLVALTDGGTVGLPYHVILRELLRLGSVQEVVDFLGSIPKAMAANYLVVDRAGNARDIETVGGMGQEVAVLEPERGVVCHTNHFLVDDYRALDARATPNAHTYSRLDALAAGLREPPADVGTVFELLRSHDGWPNSLCSHPSDDDPVTERRATLASVVASLSSSTVWIALGTPCTSQYEAYVVGANGVRRAPESDERTAPTGAAAAR